MQFRCYSCGLVFSQGLPPIEALSPAQAEMVGVEYQGDPGIILCEKLQGLSVYNFCLYCVQFVQHDKVWEDDPNHQFVHGKLIPGTFDYELNECSCGEQYFEPTYMPIDKWVYINRSIRLHKFMVHYFDEYMFRDFVDIKSEI